MGFFAEVGLKDVYILLSESLKIRDFASRVYTWAR